MAGSRDDPLLLLSAPHSSLSSSSVAATDADGQLADGAQAGSATSSLQNDSYLGGGCESRIINEAEYGFSRPDFRKAPLVGTVEHYERHVFLCYKNPEAWPARIQAADFDRLPRLLAAALSAKKFDMKRQTRLTLCEGHDGTETSNGDVLIFPDMIRYRRLTHFDVDTFVEEVLVKDTEWSPGCPERLRGWYIFVCCHASRDRRCGICGPAIVSKFKNEIDSGGQNGKVFVSACSHIGGHKYAGNLIIFGPNVKKEITGHWYGHVMPEDVPVLLEQHIGKGEIVDFLWRGQMGLSEEYQKKAQELRFQLYGVPSIESCSQEASKGSAETSALQSERISCCQSNGAAAAFSCCQNPIPQENGGDSHSPDIAANYRIEKKKSSKGFSRNNSRQSSGLRQVCSMPTWYESWEREDTYATLAVIGAAVSVFFAYKCFKQLS